MASMGLEDSPTIDPEIFSWGVPVLGICYGSQLMMHLLGGRVCRAPEREYGKTEVFVDNSSKMFTDVQPVSYTHLAKTYTLNVAGLTRELTICKVNDHMDIAAFIMLGDAELTVAAAAELLKKCPDFDILLTAEAKGIPLAHEMSRQSGKPYVCARKGVKLYMPDPVVVEDQSITTAGKQKLVIDRKELDKMSGKRVLVVDDVISTGGSLKALDELAEQTQCTIVGQAAVLAEGDAAQRKDIIFLEPLPLFLH